MSDEKSTTNTTSSTTDNYNVDELARIVISHISPTTPTSPTGSSIRTYTSPLMGTSARAAKRRMDSDSTPIRIEGTDTYNQQLQHHYQNVRQVLDDQNQSQTSTPDTSIESPQSFTAKRDFFEQRFKTPPPTYDAPPRQKIITTITSSSTTPGATSNVHDRTSSSSNESPSVDNVLEQAVELQKLSNITSTKTSSQSPPFIIERTEQYQVFLDSSNHEVRRTPSISRTSIIPLTKTGHATDLDQAQAQVGRLTDDHQAIQNLTRVLQEHNISTINEYKRLPSQTNQTTTISSSLPSNILIDRTNLSTKSDYSVLDALLNNPLGTIDDKSNQLLSVRSNDIITNLRNPEYLNSLKEPIKIDKKEKKKQPKEKKPKEEKVKEEKIKEKPKEKKSKEKKSKEKPAETIETVQHVTTATPLAATTTTTTSTVRESLPAETIEPITTTTMNTSNTITSEQAPLIDPKEKKKQDKENKKQIKTKTKSKSKSKNEDYQVLDAIISSPVSIRLPNTYLTKYNVSAPLSQSAPLTSIPPSITSNTDLITPSPSTPLITTTTKTKKETVKSKDKKVPVTDKSETLYHLAKIVNDHKTHHTTVLPSTSNIPLTESKQTIVTNKPSETIVYQQSTVASKQIESRPQSETIKPRIVYRYMDEQGHVLKISSTPPSQLREQPSQLYSYRITEPPYFHGRHIAIDDDRRHLLPQYEQHASWQGEPKLPTTLTREDFESRDKRVPQLIEQSIPTSRTVPASVDQERSSRASSNQQQHSRTYNYPNQQNIKLAWLPLSYPNDSQYIPSGTAGYETDSTMSERSATYRPYDYALNDPYHRYSNRPLYNDYYNRSPGPNYYPPQLPLSHRLTPDHGISRNYIEVFRGGDFRETKPSEIYSLPLSEHIRTSPISPTNSHHSRYDQYQSERYGTLSTNPPNNISIQQNYYNSNTLPNSRYQTNIPPTTVHTSTYYTHRNPNPHRTVQSSPNPHEYTNYIRQSKSFDYRPLRTKLQREVKITPNLLVDEWDYPITSDNNNIKYSTSTTNHSGLSSPDDVFIINNHQTVKA